VALYKRVLVDRLMNRLRWSYEAINITCRFDDVTNGRPFGAMIKPFVDAMFVGPEGGHALFDNTGNDTPAADASSAVSSQLTESQASASEAVAKQRVTSDILYRVPSSVTYTDDTVFLSLICYFFPDSVFL